MKLETEIHEISVDQLRESPFNPRKTFLDIEALAADIRSDGRVLQPLLVRDVTGKVGDEYEVVFGHRRLRAATLAGLATVPCMVRTMGDEEARRAQIRENLQRNDVHPIEEAEGFDALMREHGVTADQIVEQTGRSKSYVYGRLKLLQAVPVVRDACIANQIGSEVALLIARLPTPKLQDLALAAIKREYRADPTDGGKSSFRSIRDLLNEKFALDLKEALFDPTDATLCPDAGDCVTCPKRTGNDPAYADVVAWSEDGFDIDPNDDDDANDPLKRWHAREDGYLKKAGPDVCTDPDCFEQKKKAHLKREAQALQAKGKTVVTGNAARQAISAQGEVKGGYVPLKDVRAALKAVKGDKPESVTIQNPRDGTTVEVMRIEDLKAAGVKVTEPKSTNHRVNYAQQREDWAREEREREAKAKANTERNVALLQRVRAAIAGQSPGLVELRAIARMLAQTCEDTATLIAVRGDARFDALVKSIDGMDGAQLTQLCVDLALVDGVEDNGWGRRKPEALLAVAKHYGVPLEQPIANVPPSGIKKPPAKRAKKGKPDPVDDQPDSEGGVTDAHLAEAQP